ncbi:MAG: sulfatase-like hydrolase/transferase [Vicinamibacterales bacterium]
MMRAAFVIARALNTAYFVGTCVYCLLSYSSFAYAQFIKPQLVGWIPTAAATHHQWFMLTVAVTLPTLIPAMRRGGSVQRAAAAGYLAASVGLGLWLLVNPVLLLAGPNPRTLTLAMLCLVPPFALAVIDHVTAARPVLRRVDGSRLFVGAAAAAIAVWLAYALLIPWYVPRTVGVDLSWAALALAAGVSLLSHLLVFALVYLVAAAAVAVAALARSTHAEYWALAALSAAALSFVLHRVVASALSFQDAESWVLAGGLSLVLVAIWSGIAWQYPVAASPDGEPPDAIDLWFSPIAGRPVAVVGLVLLPLIALGLRTAVAQFDWNFLFQKLGVGLAWALALGWACLAARRFASRIAPLSRRTCDRLAVAMVVAGLTGAPAATRIAAWSGNAALEPEFVLDRYSALDASYQLLRSLLRTNAGADADLYRFLKAHSTLGLVPASPVNVDFVDGFPTPTAKPPHVFLFIVDSLRRDYLSPYNPAVTFTPATREFAAESVVFERAFTRYGATGLSVPALWIGGMMLHKQYVLPFAPMNALEKLLDGAGYRRFVSDDHLVKLFRPTPAMTLLDQQIDEMDHTLCATVDELQSQIDATAGDARTIFAMTRPLQLHTARLVRDPEPPAAAYPGFAPKYAAQVAALDSCFGGFVGYLKKKGLYDRSVVILTSDHGESLGEDGRWGHAYTLYPEVVQIPLIIRLPPALQSTLASEPTAVALSTDITPTLYALAGQPPRHLGEMYGVPLFTPAGERPPVRRRESFLLSSSYGPVHAMLRHNGRSLYIADAVQGQDLAFEMRADGRMERLTMTDVMRTVNRRLLRDHIGRIAAAYRFTPAP